MATVEDCAKLDIRVGTVVKAEPFPEARVPAIRMEIDFGSLGVKRSSAQITRRYDPSDIVGRQVVAVVNSPRKCHYVIAYERGWPKRCKRIVSGSGG
ncbi:hypothetical protein CVV65_01240 [Kyrpidia spormannii]|uniref:tRNA-binding domain-containing protein n=1 Tax=Kyrpidia spormannii TaxID=2055160 RepID=A0A2K8N2L2_9BACL|nr:hypothetical protein [Kyrpidia spormannii]ATY83773.1 hypothetical protein CVV65_01240 [Kyrpidia spormannii]